MNFQEMLGRLTADETQELLTEVLVNLTNDDAIETIVSWAKNQGVADELSDALLWRAEP